MRVGALVLALALLGAPAAVPVRADTSPTPSPTDSASPIATPSASPSPSPTPSPPASPGPTPTPSASTSTTPAPSPGSTASPAPVSTPIQPQLIDEARAKLGSGVATALSVQVQLDTALLQNQQQQQQLTDLVAQDQRQLKELDAAISERDTQIKATQARVDAEQQQLALLARAIYYQPDNLLARLLRARSLRDMLEQAGDMTAAAARSQSLQNQLNRDLSQLRTQQKKQQSDRDQQSRLLATQSAALERLPQLQGDEEQIGGNLSGAISALEAELAQLGGQDPALASKIADALQAELGQVVAAAEQAVWNQAQIWEQLNLGTIQAQLSVPSAGHSTQTQFIWPMTTGAITQPFGPTDLAIEPSYLGFPHFHTGVDVAAAEGTPVRAADDGVVALVGSGNTGYGNYVVIAHASGITTLYGHLLAAAVSQGAYVTQGQVIGLEGSTGNSTGPHVHFEVRINGTMVDPMLYLPAGGPAG